MRNSISRLKTAVAVVTLCAVSALATSATVATWTNPATNPTGTYNATNGTDTISRSGVTVPASTTLSGYVSTTWPGAEQTNPTAYHQIAVNTTGFSDIVLTFSHRSNHNQLGTAKVYYSTNGTAGPFTLAPGGTLSISNGTATNQTINLTGVTAANNIPNLVFRVHVWGSSNTGRHYAMTNLLVSGTSLASIAYSSYVISGGNDNQFFDASECNTMFVTVYNSGIAGITGVSSTLSSTTPGVFVNQPSSAYDNIAASASGTNTTAFLISTTQAFSGINPISFNLTITANEGTFVTSFSSTVPPSSSTRVNAASTGAISDSVRNGRVTYTDFPLAVSGLTGSISNVSVLMHATHPRVSDLRISLIAPDGTPISLMNRRGGGQGQNVGAACSPDDQRTTFDDGAATAISSGNAPFTGTFRPEQPLAQLLGKFGTALNGTWKLRIGDSKRGNSGSLNCWSLDISTAPTTPSTGACNPSPTAEVSLAKTATVGTVVTGGALVYTLTVTNNGPDNANNIVLTDPLPDDVDYVSASATGGGVVTQNSGFVQVTWPTLLNGASQTVTINTLVNTAGTIVNEGHVTANEVDVNTLNNRASVTKIVDPVADIVVTNTDSPDPVVTGQNLTYTVTVTNNGPDGATDVVLTDVFPAGSSLVSANSTHGTPVNNAGTITCPIGDLDDQESATATFVVTPAECGTATNTASATATEFDPNTLNNTNITQQTSVNNPAPVVSIGSPSSSLTATGPVSFPITISGATSVNLTAGAVVLNGSGATGTISVLNGTTASPTVQISSITGNGTIGISINAGVATACGGTASAAAGPSVTFNVDNTAPTVSVTGPASPTNSSTITFTLTFSEAVSNLTAAGVTVTGGTKGSLAGGPTVYTLPVTPTGQGAVTCQVPASAAQDAASNNSTASNNLSITYDSEAPTVSVTGPASPTNSSPITFTISFDEAVSGFSASGISVTGGAKGALSGSGPYTIDVTPSGDGLVTCQVNASAAQDAAGNNSVASNLTSVDFDATAPAADLVVESTSGPTNATSVSFDVTFSEYVTGFNNVVDVEVTHSGTAHGGVTVSGSGANYTVTVTGITGDGSFTVAVSTSSTVMDAAGNALASSATSGAVTIDNTAPKVASITPSSGSEVIITFTEANSMGSDVLLPATYTASGPGLNGLSANPDSVIALGGNSYQLTWTGGTMTNGASLTNTVAGTLTDAAGNAISPSANSANTTALPVTMSGFSID